MKQYLVYFNWFTIFENIKQLMKAILWRSTLNGLEDLFSFSILLLIDIFDKTLNNHLEYLSFNYNEIFKQSLKIIIIYSLLTLFIFILFKNKLKNF